MVLLGTVQHTDLYVLMRQGALERDVGRLKVLYHANNAFSLSIIHHIQCKVVYVLALYPNLAADLLLSGLLESWHTYKQHTNIHTVSRTSSAWSVESIWTTWLLPLMKKTSRSTFSSGPRCTSFCGVSAHVYAVSLALSRTFYCDTSSGRYCLHAR